ncbi:MAG: hypothetical protein ACYC97_11605 [Metallibacterium sp.]
MTGAEPLVNVALAVVQRGDGRVPLADRSRGKIAGGYSQLPGGSFNALEKSEWVLARKLHEGIDFKLDRTHPWITCEHEYFNKRVRLRSFGVTVWRGATCGSEGRRVSWEDPEAATIAPFLPANALVLEVLPDSAAWEAMRDWLACEAGRSGANGNIGVAIL